jgi:hypothetical protein
MHVGGPFGLPVPDYLPMPHAQRVVQILVGKTAIGPGLHLVLGTQPPTHVLLHHFVDSDHGPQTEVVDPAIQLLVERPDFRVGVPLARLPIRYLAKLAAQLPDLFQRGSSHPL